MSPISSNKISKSISTVLGIQQGINIENPQYEVIEEIEDESVIVFTVLTAVTVVLVVLALVFSSSDR